MEKIKDLALDELISNLTSTEEGVRASAGDPFGISRMSDTLALACEVREARAALNEMPELRDECERLGRELAQLNKQRDQAERVLKETLAELVATKKAVTRIDLPNVLARTNERLVLILERMSHPVIVDRGVDLKGIDLNALSCGPAEDPKVWSR